MRRFSSLLAVVAWASLDPSLAHADTLVLRSGKSLKIDALSCQALACRVTFPGGEAEIAAAEVVRVEPDERDLEAAAVTSPATPKEPQTAIAGVRGESPRLTSETRPVEQIIAEAAHLYGLPRSLVRAVARAESSFNATAVSPKGAQGVMQLMPGTARELGVRNSFDPVENIHAGAKLLRQLLEKYQGRVAEALAAYNAGPGAVARYQGVPPYSETRGYIRRVVKDFQKDDAARDRSAGKPR